MCIIAPIAGVMFLMSLYSENKGKSFLIKIKSYDGKQIHVKSFIKW